MRQFFLVVVKLGVSITLLYFALRRMDFSTIGVRLNHLEPGWIAVALVIALLQIALAAFRWQRIALICGAALPFRQALQFNFIAAFFNQVLPSTVGGDAARIWLLARAGAGWWKATYSVLLDRFIGVLMLAAVVAVGLYWSFQLIENPIGRSALLVIGLGSLAAGAAFLALGRIKLLERYALTRRLLDMSALARLILFSRESAPLIMTASLLIHVVSAVIAWALANAVAVRLELLPALLLIPPVLLIATVPISIAGWGVRESALVLAFAYAGLPENDGLIVSVLLGGVMFVTGIVGGLVWLANPQSVRISAAWRSGPLPPAPQA